MSQMVRRDTRDPFAETMFGSMLDRFFAEPFFAPGTALARLEEGTLAVDISENASSVVVRASLPGFRKEDVEISLDDNVLTINARQQEEKEEKTERFYRKERRYGSLSRRVALPAMVNENGATAELKDGVLTLTLPKAQVSEPKRLKIK